ncbi:MAG: glycerol-3-phosphate acyltransferase, partial [Alphaproteobacteria bacterium]|nr:glycerol-3-phosphate acyltransferase [Alphaproteobacteria bacterium]
MVNFIGIIISYLFGSVPMGLILTKIVGKGDLRKVGSGNIGATNVMRVGGLRMAGLVWILDMAKAIAAVFLGKYIAGEAFGAWCGFAAIVGHCYPIWLKFKGGKGISSLFGVLLAVS